MNKLKNTVMSDGENHYRKEQSDQRDLKVDAVIVLFLDLHLHVCTHGAPQGKCGGQKTTGGSSLPDHMGLGLRSRLWDLVTGAFAC